MDAILLPGKQVRTWGQSIAILPPRSIPKTSSGCPTQVGRTDFSTDCQRARLAVRFCRYFKMNRLGLAPLPSTPLVRACGAEIAFDKEELRCKLLKINGAGDGTRTRDVQLGKLLLD